MNMDIDIHLSEKCPADEATLRFYRWNPYCISLGANQNMSDVNEFKAMEDYIDIVFRPTGGRAILHAEELTYSVIYPMDKNVSNRQMYHEINSAIIKGLENYSSKLGSLAMENIQPNFADQYKKQLGAVCFAIPAKSEIKFGGKKLVGSAQKKMKNALLQHGSIICGDYHLKIVDYLNIPPDNISYYKSELSEKTTDLGSILGETIDYEILQECVEKGFSRQFNAEFDIIESEEAASNYFIN